MGAQPPLEIPGSSIRPPDDEDDKYWCPHCRHTFKYPKKKNNPETGQQEKVCPYCGAKIED